MKKGTIASAGLILSILLALTVLPFNPVELADLDSSDATIEYHSSVCKHITRADGTIEYLGCNENTLTDVGKTLINNWINSTNASYVNGLVLGNTSVPAAGSTTHPGKIADCGLTEHTITTWGEVATGNQSTNHEWTVSCAGGILVNSTGLESNNAHYFAGNTFTDVTLQNNDKINVTWYIWVV